MSMKPYLNGVDMVHLNNHTQIWHKTKLLSQFPVPAKRLQEYLDNLRSPVWKSLMPHWKRDYLTTDEYITPEAFLQDLLTVFKLDGFAQDKYPFLGQDDEVISFVNSHGVGGVHFFNPPYSGNGKSDAYAQMVELGGRSMLLVPNTITEQRWFFKALTNPLTNVYAVQGRISFNRYTPETGLFKAEANRTGSLLITLNMNPLPKYLSIPLEKSGHSLMRLL